MLTISIIVLMVAKWRARNKKAMYAEADNAGK